MTGPRRLYVAEEHNWRDHAACAGKPADMFFPERGADIRDALAICRGCDVRDECLNHALTRREPVGIWGGLSHQQLRILWQSTTPRRSPIHHGTEYGYKQHLRRGEKPCQQCAAANATATRISKTRARNG